VFVNHVTTNPFFVPTKYGAEDTCALLGYYQWTGSEKSIATDAGRAQYGGLGGRRRHRRVLVDLTAFNEPG
jgi:simple sugar transport system substrate-binding protein